MDLGPLFPGMVNTVGALLPALISLGLVLAGWTRSRLCTGDQIWLGVFSIALSAVLARMSVSPGEVSLHMPPGATLFVCYLVWRGYYISPGLAFALTYTSILPVDLCLSELATGSQFDTECIGGAGWRDGLLIFPALTAVAVGYANWRMAKAGRAGLFWLGQGTPGLAPESAQDDHVQRLGRRVDDDAETAQAPLEMLSTQPALTWSVPARHPSLPPADAGGSG